MRVEPGSEAAAAGMSARRRRRERGQSIVETSLVLPIFLLVILAILDFGFGFHNYITLTNAAREGARFGVVMAEFEPDEVEAETQQRLHGHLKSNAVISVSCTALDPEASGCPPQSEVSVQIEYEYKYITPLGPLFNLLSLGEFPKQVTMSSETTMRRE